MARSYTKRDPKEFNLARDIFQGFVARWVYGTYFRLISNFKVIGKENIPKDRFFIVASNHVSAVDPFIIRDALRCPMAYMAKIELFQASKFFARHISNLGAFAVNRAKLDISTVKTIKEIVKANWSLGIFPQGSVRKNKKIDKINKGFTVMAKMMQYDIVPMSITGCETYNWNIFKTI